jgi:hypothetical protein
MQGGEVGGFLGREAEADEPVLAALVHLRL